MEVVLIWLVVIVVGLVSTFYLIKIRNYRKAKDEIFTYVKSFKHRCKGESRFVVTVETLQDAFREYETPLIEKVWLELVKEKVIVQHPLDNEWSLM